MSGLFGSKPPPPKPIPPMPDEDSPQIKEAERRKRAEILSRGGRQASILSQATDSASVPYSASKMGRG